MGISVVLHLYSKVINIPSIRNVKTDTAIGGISVVKLRREVHLSN
jgi:hypothetical protein